ncbi:hypothetical protein AZE42_01587 [Rhizopogon vesiculosus]|uniref:GDP/GTP exchange factor Sec2 N-terminal domain-containing protein n=1 Tax=Rhizopogon vesiculosus TaxID=180088 RepID=A0A1J8RFH6_9AGAM|nr:hypothetical protein AZE42_01587 [Rhizopogon vesiculosus]
MLSNLTFGSPNVQTRIPSSRSSVQESHLSPTSAVFANIDDELHDARRVHSHGQEEDLRYALDRVIKRVEELVRRQVCFSAVVMNRRDSLQSSLLKIAYKTHTELETSLSVAKSNLQLMMSNNEMLEEALRRDTPCSAKDVGWRRWSAREAQNMQRLSEEERSRSFDYGPLNESGAPSHPTNAPTVVVNGTQPSRPSTPSESPAPPSTTSQSNQEGRFFRFRYGIRSPAVQQHASHLTSPSLPTLVASSREKELLELQEQLERERRAHEVAITEKVALEAELESLSQALFEEANKMVATERVKRAETEEELQEVRLEKDALKEALRLIEGENGQLRLGSAQLSTGGISNHTAQQSYSHSRSSSRDAIKSPPLSSLSLPPSPPSNPDDIAVLALQPSAASFSAENPNHLADFLLQPAPKTTFTTLHQKSRPKEEVTSNASGDNSLYIPDEPSPWA